MPNPVERAGFRGTVASVLLDLMRGLAALLVLLDHTHQLFFVDMNVAVRSAAHPLLVRLGHALASAGVDAVIIFFVLSGYLISGSIYRDLHRGRWQWKRYLAHRFVRLWLVLLPALVLGVGWDLARLVYLRGGHIGGLQQAAALEGITPLIFAGNVAFLQSIHVPTLGSNRVLWSLAFEFWYYMLFPLALLSVRRGTAVWLRVVYAFLLVAICALVGRPVLALFPVWLLGSVLARVRAPAVGAGVRGLASLVYAGALLWIMLHPWNARWFKQDYVLGLLTAMFLWVWLSAVQRAREGTPVDRAIRRLAEFSYSLYLVHYPLLAFLAAVLTGGVLWRAAVWHLAVAFGLMLLAIAYSLGVASVTEFQNDRVRRWVETRLGV